MEYEELRAVLTGTQRYLESALTFCHDPKHYQERLLEAALENVLHLKRRLCAPSAASSPQKPEEPSAESTCEHGGGRGVAGECGLCGKTFPAPRKVWVVRGLGLRNIQVFSSLEAATSYLGGTPSSDSGWAVTEYEVADGPKPITHKYSGGHPEQTCGDCGKGPEAHRHE